jgi:hypothetical protein
LAESRKRRRNTLTRFAEDIVDDTRDLVDDVVDRAKDVERDARKEARRAVEGDAASDRWGHELEDLKSAIDDLAAKVNRLVALQARNGRHES